MRVVRGETDLQDRIEVQVDPSADPVSWDEAVARFLLAYARSKARASEAPETEQAER